MQDMQQQQQQCQKAAEREILCIKRVNYRLHYEYFSLEQQSILQVIEGVITTTNGKDMEFKNAVRMSSYEDYPYLKKYLNAHLVITINYIIDYMLQRGYCQL